MVQGRGVPFLITPIQNSTRRTSLAVQFLRLCASNAGSVDSIPSWGTKIPRPTQQSQNKTKQTNKSSTRNSSSSN